MNEQEIKLEVVRISSEADSTSGLLFDVTNGKRKFLAYTLEDEHRKEKEMLFLIGKYNPL
jgi:hypothetical protein